MAQNVLHIFSFFVYKFLQMGSGPLRCKVVVFEKQASDKGRVLVYSCFAEVQKLLITGYGRTRIKS